MTIDVSKNDLGAHGDVKITTPLADAQDAGNPVQNAVTPDLLGVSQQQFDKYYDAEKNAYNWQAHAREQDYIAQQKAATGDDAAAQGAGDEQDPAPDVAPDGEADAQQAVSDAGLDWDDLGNKIILNGDLDKADYDALAKIGLPEDIIKDYVDTKRQAASAHVSNVVKAFGGEDNMDKARAWAQANLSQKQIDTFDDLLASPADFQAAVDIVMHKAGLVKKAGKAVATPNATTGGGAASAVKPFANEQEQIAAMRNPLYSRHGPEGEAYRQKVYQRMAVSQSAVGQGGHTAGL